MMLINTIESSPHTRPQKTKNRTIYDYPEFLGRQWKFGYESDNRGADEDEDNNDDDDDDDDDEDEDDDDDMVDVVNIGGHVTMRHHGTLRSTG